MSNKDKYTWLTSLLTGWGVKESWAKIIAGAIIGALVCAGVLALDSCAVRYTQSAAGDIELNGTVVLPEGFRK